MLLNESDSWVVLLVMLHSHSPLPAVTTQTLATQVMNYVRDRVQNGEMDTESWYSVYQLSEELGISRSPVRDGLLRLEEAGVIEFVRNRGFRIIEPEASDVADIFSLRMAIEPAAAGRAARDITEHELKQLKSIVANMSSAMNANDEPGFFTWDQELHDAILAAGHARRGRDVVNKLRTHTRLLSDSTVRTYRSLEQVHSEHLPIIEALENHDPKRARAAMRAHLEATGLLLLRQALSRHNPELTPTELAEKVASTWVKHVD